MKIKSDTANIHKPNYHITISYAYPATDVDLVVHASVLAASASSTSALVARIMAKLLPRLPVPLPLLPVPQLPVPLFRLLVPLPWLSVFRLLVPQLLVPLPRLSVPLLLLPVSLSRLTVPLPRLPVPLPQLLVPQLPVPLSWLPVPLPRLVAGTSASVASVPVAGALVIPEQLPRIPIIQSAWMFQRPSR